MPTSKQWTNDQAPTWAPNSVIGTGGWVNPDDPMCPRVAGKFGASSNSNVGTVSFVSTELNNGDELAVNVRFVEKVDVPAGSNLTVSWSGGDDIVLYAAEQLDVNDVLFDKQNDNSTAEVVPVDESGTLSIAAQTIVGDIEDVGTSTDADKDISASQASDAGTIALPAATITSVAFNSDDYTQGDDLGVTVTFSEAVDVTAGANIVIGWSGAGGDVTLYAEAQSDTTTVVFDKQNDNSTAEVVPSETGDLSIADQTLTGTVVDAGTSVVSDLALGASEASDAGTISVA